LIAKPKFGFSVVAHQKAEPKFDAVVKFFRSVTAIAALLLVSRNLLQAASLPSQEPLPNFDRRMDATRSAVANTKEQISAAETLRAKLPDVRVEFDPITGSSKNISMSGGFLTDTNGEGRAVSIASLAAIPADDPHRSTKAFLREHAALFGHGPEVLDTARITRDYTTAHNSLKTVVWQQQIDGISVFEAVLISHTTKRGELVTLSSQFLRDPVHAIEHGSKNGAAIVTAPPVSAQQAVASAARNLGDKIKPEQLTTSSAEDNAEQKQTFTAQTFKGEAEAKLTWLPMDRQTLRLCWDVVLMSRSRNEMFRMLVDAETGDVVLRRCLTAYLADASYRVYTSDSPSPFSPGWPTPQSEQPPYVARTVVTLPAMDTNASPSGWIDDGVNETRGNNVDAHTDRNNDDSPDLPRPQGSPFRVFDFPMDLTTQDPTNYSAAAVVQLFYLCNRYHDVLYGLGFTEAAGNFQNNNFSRGGLGNDAVQADAQDGGGTDNANFSTPPDGSPGRMQMYLFSGPSPRRDGDLDAEIIFHEHTHGVSWRLVGGGQALGDTQSDGMGEGWSDFYSLCLLSDPGDDVNGNYAAGGYATYQLGGLTQNYYFGIRRYPYSTDMTKNPLTFKDIDPAQASAHGGIPRSPIIGSTANEVHNEGEVWCVTLWDARANLINKHGWAVGNHLILQLVTDGMKLTVPHPNFLQARDAILQADMVDTGGANQNELWTAFAKRGMGFSATSPASSTTSGIKEAFDLPDPLRVSPNAAFSSYGQWGGPFSPLCRNFSVTNIADSNLLWTVTATESWIDLSTGGGTLSVGGSGSVNVCINGSANSLPPGTYAASIIFSNLATGRTLSRSVSLEIVPPRIVFFPLDADPGWSRQGEWAFGKPAGLGGASHGSADPGSGYTGTNVFGINLNGDYSTSTGGPYYLTMGPINCSAFNGVQLQFQRWLNTDYQSYVYAAIEISTNGSAWNSIWNNGTSTIADSTWTRVNYDISAYADQQSTVYIRWSHRVASSGAYAFSGWNLDDIELRGTPNGPLSILLPGSVLETSGAIVNGGTLQLFSSLPTNLTVTLTSSAPSRLAVPPTITIPAGQTFASFDLILTDNSIHDGNQIATLEASATGFPDVYNSITVIDDDTAPTVITSPTNIVVPVGSNATFNVTASGKSPLGYFWRRNGAIISGANGSSYTTNNVQLTDSGIQFDCIVTNIYGAATSSIATLTVISGPSNDVCSSAIVIPSTTFSISQSTTLATSTGDPAPKCVGSFGKGVWYSFTAPNSGTYMVDTIGSDFDTGLGIYVGGCGWMAQVACDDDSGGNHASKITFSAISGITYYILAGGYGGESGNLVFHLAPGYSNDTCSSATIISNTSFATIQSTAAATSAGDPIPTCISGFGKGVWFRFTAPASGMLVVDTIGSDFDTGLGIFTGTCGAFNQVGCDNDSGGNLTSKVTLAAVKGTTYYILAGGSSAASGTLTFHLNLMSPPLLDIAITATNVLLRWSAAGGDFVLESSPTLISPSWTRVPSSPVLNGSQYNVWLSNSSSNAFYRLKLTP
jgi:hypothetical protein